jgi:hypothetical protein
VAETTIEQRLPNSTSGIERFGIGNFPPSRFGPAGEEHAFGCGRRPIFKSLG